MAVRSGEVAKMDLTTERRIEFVCQYEISKQTTLNPNTVNCAILMRSRVQTIISWILTSTKTSLGQWGYKLCHSLEIQI